MKWNTRLMLGQFCIVLAAGCAWFAFGMDTPVGIQIFNVLVGASILGGGIHQLVIAGIEAAAEIAERKRGPLP